MAGVPVFGGLLILSILIIHNPGYIEGSRRESIATKAGEAIANSLEAGEAIADRKRDNGKRDKRDNGKRKNGKRDNGKDKGKRDNKKRGKNKLKRKEVSPDEAFGFLTLNSTYNKYESPDNETRVGVWMEPTFVIEIDSLARRMGLVVKLEVTWQDERVWWKKDDITNPGDNFTFDTSILQ